MSVPNQRVVIIEKPLITSPFLQISAADWQEAYQILTRGAFGVYLLLAQNCTGYHYEYSPEAIHKLGLMSKSTASRAFTELTEQGYIEGSHFYVQSRARREAAHQIQSQILGRS